MTSYLVKIFTGLLFYANVDNYQVWILVFDNYYQMSRALSNNTQCVDMSKLTLNTIHPIMCIKLRITFTPCWIYSGLIHPFQCFFPSFFLRKRYIQTDYWLTLFVETCQQQSYFKSDRNLSCCPW